MFLNIRTHFSQKLFVGNYFMNLSIKNFQLVECFRSVNLGFNPCIRDLIGQINPWVQSVLSFVDSENAKTTNFLFSGIRGWVSPIKVSIDPIPLAKKHGMKNQHFFAFIRHPTKWILRKVQEVAMFPEIQTQNSPIKIKWIYQEGLSWRILTFQRFFI